MTTDRILEPSETLRDAFRLAENIKIAYELVEEKSPKGNRKFNYLLQNLHQEIDAILTMLSDTMDSSKDGESCEEVDYEVVTDENSVEEEGKVI
jgi:hypothetical protein